MSDLSRATARARRQIGQEEAPIRRAMREAYRLAIERIEAELVIVARQLVDQPMPDSWFDARGRFTRQGELLFRQQRLRRLLPLVEAEFARFSDTGMRLLRDGQLRAVSGGAAEAWELMDAAGVTASAGITGVAVNRPAVERLVAALQNGPVRDVLDGYGGRAAKVIERLMLQGVVTGEGPRQIVKRIVGELDNGATRARLDVLTRTELLRAFRGSLFDQYAVMGLEHWTWSSALSKRTCLACLARHGMRYPMTKPFMAAHPMCRCVPSPWSKDVRVESGPDWFARQSVETQRLMMPSGAAYDAFQREEVKLTDFVGHRESKVWGRSIRERSGREVLARVA